MQDFLNGLKITIKVKYSDNSLLVIGTGPWSQKIKSVLDTNSNQIEITSIGARDFLRLDPTNIGINTEEQISKQREEQKNEYINIFVVLFLKVL